MLAAGIDPAHPVLRAVAQHRVPGTLIWSTPSRLDERAQQLAALLVRDRATRVLMETARRAGVPMSEARDRWTVDPDDVAWEVALDAVDTAAALARCPNCGMDPDLLLEPDPPHRPLEFGPLKLHWGTCFACSMVAAAERDVTDDDRRAGVFLQWRPRQPGDPLDDRL